MLYPRNGRKKISGRRCAAVGSTSRRASVGKMAKASSPWAAFNPLVRNLRFMFLDNYTASQFKRGGDDPAGRSD
jgi:hypothetical protein